MTPNQVGVAVGTMALLPLLRQEVLRAYPKARLHESAKILSEDELIEFLQGCDGAIIGMEPITERVLSALPGLKVIGKFGVGTDSIDFSAMVRHKVRFGYERGVNRLSVAELAIGFAICALRGVTESNLAMRAGQRPRAMLGRLLSGRTVGIHGCGAIGKELVRLLKPFHCEVLACDLVDYAEFNTEFGVTQVTFPELLQRSEVLSLHLPLNTSTHRLYDASALTKLRPDCILINTCRGGVVDEQALLQHLENGRLQAACFDVFSIEPADNDRLLNLPNFLSTPHIGASAIEARLAMARAAINGLAESAMVQPGQFEEI